MLELFKNPPAEYLVTPLWSLHKKLDQKEIERQLREMRAKGVGGFFIHEPPGLRDDYRGKEWMRCVEHACDIAKELGMHVCRCAESNCAIRNVPPSTARSPKQKLCSLIAHLGNRTRVLSVSMRRAPDCCLRARPFEPARGPNKAAHSIRARPYTGRPLISQAFCQASEWSYKQRNLRTSSRW